MTLTVPQATHRTLLYNITIAAVLNQEGLYYDDLVDILAFNVTNQEALAIITRRRRRTISETDQRAIASGKRYVARAFIDRAQRYGRLVYSDDTPGHNNGTRTVWLCRPPKGGGPSGVQRTWQDERRNVSDETAALLDRTIAQLG